MTAEPAASRRTRTAWLRLAGWAGLGVLLVASSVVSYAVAVLIGR